MYDIFSENNKQLVFLVGVPRSGTTWLQKLLHNHPSIGSAQESHLFNTLISPMITAWENALNFNDGRGGVGIPAYMTEQEFNQKTAEYIYNILNQSDDFRNNQLFIEKTPDHLIHIDNIKRLIPSAKFIFVQRNPLDVIESLLAASQTWGKDWAPNNVFKAIRLYRNYQRVGLKQLKALDPNSLFTTSYESMKNNIDSVLNDAFEFIGLDCNKELISELKSKETTLKKHGEFAKRSGGKVIEPAGFHRKKKAKLSFIQKLLINMTIRYEPLT